MDFEGCLTSEEKQACMQLLSSGPPSFLLFPHERKIRLAISPPPLNLALNLTIQHAECNFSCEGGDLSSCDVFKTDRYWPDVSTPLYIGNCTHLHYYCIAASIGECCPICTQTRFMEDYQKEYHYEDSWQWNPELLILSVIILIILFVRFVVVLRNHLNEGYKSTGQMSQDIMIRSMYNDSLTQHILDVESNNPRIRVVCLYLRENNMQLLDMIYSIQEFLRRARIDVIDIYEEEENINRSVRKWVQEMFNKENSKVLLLDTPTTHDLWNGTVDSTKVLKPLEQVFGFVHDLCIQMRNVHNQLFVIRFQGMDFDTKTFIDLCDGRCYIYPIHRGRLINDLKS